jgi:hypothetical protein
MNRLSSFAIAAISALATTSCSTSSIVCPSVLSTALDVKVKDSQSGQFIASATTISGRFNGVVGFADVIYPGGPGSDSLPIHVFGKGGTYDITLRRAGYSDAVESGINVPSQGVCSEPQRVSITAQLTKAP